MEINLNKMESIVQNDVLIGKGQYLFLHQGGQCQFDYLQSKKIVDNESIQNFTTNIKQRVDYFNEKKIRYKHVVFPSKPLIKTKYLPIEYQNIESIFRKYYKDALDPMLQEYVLHPVEILNEAEKSNSTFYTYDTHNSGYGSLTIMNYLLKQINLPQLDQNVYHILEQERSDDLAIKLNMTNTQIESVMQVNIKSNALICSNQADLPGNTNIMRIVVNFKALHKKRLLIFGDSFFAQMLYILKDLFSEILFIRSAFIHKDIIERFKPDVVFTGNAERYLSKVQNDMESNDILLALYGNKDYVPNMEFLWALKAQLSYGYYKSEYDNWKQSIIFENLIKSEDATELLKEVATLFERSNYRQVSKNITSSQTALSIRITQFMNRHKTCEIADILREIALIFEQENDIETAKTIMEKAAEFRKGPVILKKLRLYTSLLEH